MVSEALAFFVCVPAWKERVIFEMAFATGMAFYVAIVFSYPVIAEVVNHPLEIKAKALAPIALCFLLDAV